MLSRDRQNLATYPKIRINAVWLKAALRPYPAEMTEKGPLRKWPGNPRETSTGSALFEPIPIK